MGGPFFRALGFATEETQPRGRLFSRRARGIFVFLKFLCVWDVAVNCDVSCSFVPVSERREVEVGAEIWLVVGSELLSEQMVI